MNSVTALKKFPGTKKVAIYIDGKYSFSVLEDIVVREKLFIGKTLDKEELQGIIKSNTRSEIYLKCIELIGRRPRSTYEITRFLSKKMPDDISSTSILDELKEKNYLNDKEFTLWWLNNRRDFKQKSRLELIKELKNKGIENDLINETLKDTYSSEEEIDSVKQIIAKQLRKYEGKQIDEAEKTKKIKQYLFRKGFSWDIIVKAF